MPAQLAKSIALIALTALFACARGERSGDDSDAGLETDAGASADSGSDGGAGSNTDAGSGPDAGSNDAGALSDGGSNLDAGTGFAGGFVPRGGSGGFGGGDCTAVHTPIVFIHGNTDDASVWTRPSSTGDASVIASFVAAGYNDCELWGLSWLTPAEQQTPELIFHDLARATLIRNFLDDVRAYTGKTQLDIVAHSMGVTLALHALEGAGQVAGLRRFVAIAGGMSGLESCISVGPADPAFPTCGSQSLTDPDTFGFYPDANWRMQGGGFRDRPGSSTASYYSICAGESDEILCPSCSTALFDSAPNLLAQVNVGQGTPVQSGDDDSTGVGHFRARTNSGPIIVNMLTSPCTGTTCCTGATGICF